MVGFLLRCKFRPSLKALIVLRFVCCRARKPPKLPGRCLSPLHRNAPFLKVFSDVLNCRTFLRYRYVPVNLYRLTVIPAGGVCAAVGYEI